MGVRLPTIFEPFLRLSTTLNLLKLSAFNFASYEPILSMVIDLAISQRDAILMAYKEEHAPWAALLDESDIV
jgi:hypothetical protein